MLDTQHTFNKQSGLLNILNVHKKIKNIVEFFKRSTKSNIKLKQTQTEMG